ncbi:MAG: aspartate--ammonia ligase [candidate division Zixibacteria bacterium]|nr:aspartate--ammonia ligase [candidate division Zixibacteria bacterium]MBU1472035.1 aspartate--ammonia ligase [candidate division Zixibacteria bacterium]MBU2626343.1 aspartate--ammonia ligase [candidate division Zixibacteria bacterium]
MKTSFRIPEEYTSALSVCETETAIKEIKDFFQDDLAAELNLNRVTAPLFVEAGTGINDDLNGVDRPVSFTVRDLGHRKVEVVQSLAKWKRLTLAELRVPAGEGIYTDMNAIRPDEELDNLHSIYVDQWDWERVITPQQRNLDELKQTVQQIYSVIRRTESHICRRFPALERMLPNDIVFVHANELEDHFPELSPGERECQIAREHGAVFIIGIGAPLRDGKPHDGRAPDYDDWITPNGRGCGLNGDIIIWYPILNVAFELSSMGIRVTPDSLKVQLQMTGTTDREKLYYHRRLLAGDLPLTIGGGIGQSRLCMMLLRKAHIGEIQVGIWPDEVRTTLRDRQIVLL